MRLIIQPRRLVAAGEASPTGRMLTGEIYGVDFDSSGRILSIAGIFHP